jgi:hypothetical protein
MAQVSGEDQKTAVAPTAIELGAFWLHARAVMKLKSSSGPPRTMRVQSM